MNSGPFAKFLRVSRSELLEQWEQALRREHVGDGLPALLLRDHIPELLEEMAQVLDPRSGVDALGEAPDVHAISRLEEGYDVATMVKEYAILRGVIFSLWQAKGGGPLSGEAVNRVCAVLDDAVHTGVVRYSDSQERTLNGLDRIAAAANEGKGVDRILEELIRVIHETTPAVSMVTILLREGELLRTRASVGLEEEVRGRFVLRIGEGFSGTIAQERRPLFVAEASSSPLIRSDEIRRQGIRALYGVPLLHDDELVGVAQIGSTTAPEFSTVDRQLFRAMAQQAASVIAQGQLAERELHSREEAQRAEDALRMSELRFRLALQNTGTTVFEQDTELRYRWIYNPQLQLSEQEVVGRTDAEMFSAGAERLIELKQRALSQGRRIRDEVSLASGGDPRHFLVELEPLRDEAGRITGVMGAATDITERKHFEEELHAAARFREEFIGILGHDLRNPITAIKMSAHVLLTRGNLNAPQNKSVARIADSADRMDQLIRDVLDFTRGRMGGGLTVERDRVDLGAACQRVVEELNVAHPDARIEVEARGDLHGEWDANRVEQAVSNLVANAIQHGRAGAPIRVRVEDEGEQVTVSVHNFGPAIPEHQQLQLFEPFRRRGDGSGLGLGLYIVRLVVEAHGGRVKARSTEEEGTTFTLVFPRTAAAAQAEPVTH